MTITIVPFTINPVYDSRTLPVEYGREKHVEKNHAPITYWGVYLDDKYISYTSSRELAEKTKAWMEKWLRLT